jgi:hypothetical protein
MLKTIILLTGNAHQQHALAALLREHNPALAFRGAVTRDELLAIAPELLRDARLVAFPGRCSMRSVTAPTIFIPARPIIPAGRRRISRSMTAPKRLARRRM